MKKAKKRETKIETAEAAEQAAIARGEAIRRTHVKPAPGPMVAGLVKGDLDRGFHTKIHSLGRRAGFAVLHHSTLAEYAQIPRPSWSKGVRTYGRRVAFAILHCSCHTDTIFEFDGSGKRPPKAKCCVNAPEYPTDPAYTAHLHVAPQMETLVSDRLENLYKRREDGLAAWAAGARSRSDWR